MSFQGGARGVLLGNANNGPLPRPLGLREPGRALAPFNAASVFQRNALRDAFDPEYIPRRVNRPKTKLLIDTTYPRHLYRNFNPEDVQAASVEEPDFVTINGIRTRKRRAQDTEVDLVLANEGRVNAVPQEPINARPRVDPARMRPRSMLDSIHRTMRKMMGGVRDVLVTAKEAIHHLLNPRANQVAELRSFEGGHVRNKRVKLSEEQEKLEWIPVEVVPYIIDKAFAFHDSILSIGVSVQDLQGDQRLAVNRMLRPLTHVLADNPSDLQYLLHNEADLTLLFCLLVDQVTKLLRHFYSIKMLARLRHKHKSNLPYQIGHDLLPSDFENIHRIKNFLSAPALLTILNDIILACKVENAVISAFFIDRCILDLEAICENMAMPTFISSPHYFAKWQQIFPKPKRTDLVQNLLLPGSFPEDEEPEDIITTSAKPALPLKVLSPPRHSPPSTAIAQTDTSPMAYHHARFTAHLAHRLTALPGQFRDHFYNESQVHHEIKKSYASDFEAKNPLKPEEIGIVRSILKSRKKKNPSPKRLRMKQPPKAVRFTATTLSPQPRSHVGLDVPRLNTDGTVVESEPLVYKHLENFSPEKLGTSRSGPGRNFKWDKSTGDPDARIKELFAVPSIFSLSSGGQADIAIEKEEAELRAAEESRLAAEQAQREAEEARIAADEQARLAAQEQERQAAEEARLAAEEQERQAAEEARLAAEVEAQAQAAIGETSTRPEGLRVPRQGLVQTVDDGWTTRARETLHASSTTILASTPEGVELRRHDFEKVVNETEWLNDEIVNGSLVWLDQAINSAAGIKNARLRTRKCLSMSSFFFKRLRERGVTGTERTLRRSGVEPRNFFDVDTIFLPICENSHWTLIVIRPGKRTVAHMDSLNPRGNAQYANLALSWVSTFLGAAFDPQAWRIVVHDAPLQTNGYDCGVHTITNAMCLALGLSPIDSYESSDMPLQRIRIACMFLNGGFKDDFDLRVY